MFRTFYLTDYIPSLSTLQPRGVSLNFLRMLAFPPCTTKMKCLIFTMCHLCCFLFLTRNFIHLEFTQSRLCRNTNRSIDTDVHFLTIPPSCHPTKRSILKVQCTLLSSFFFSIHLLAQILLFFTLMRLSYASSWDPDLNCHSVIWIPLSLAPTSACFHIQELDLISEMLKNNAKYCWRFLRKVKVFSKYYSPFQLPYLSSCFISRLQALESQALATHPSFTNKPSVPFLPYNNLF